MTQLGFYYRHAGFALASILNLLLWACLPAAEADTDPKYYAVQASAAVQVNPPQITLQWPADSNATGYSVSRKLPQDKAWGAATPLPGNATSYVDNSVAVGVGYEYQLSKTTSAGYAGFGYVCAGINAPAIENRGKVLFIVDNLYASDLAPELARFQQDLVGDGWVVLRHDVSRNDSPANIKSIIQSDYAGDPANVRAVFLFGHIPVAYSGDFNPDGHPNHQGAWPADVYYADMNGTWTDNSVNNTGAERQANWNVPGDGKFDQSQLPADAVLEVGRVDLSDMTCFSNKTPARYEEDLLRQYLNKDHNFRFGLLQVPRRGVICDNFGEKSGEAFAASGWRNFSAFFGADNVTAVAGWDYFPTVSSQGYLWSYGCGGGGYTTCDGIGSSDGFATNDIQTVFTMFIGSYFGDWDNESNFLRAPLGSTSYTLAVAWAGRPHWFFHHMGLGETIGYSTRLSQNNRPGGLYSPQNYDTAGVHVALMGDPTLRLHPVIPPSNLNGSASPAGLTLTWSPSTDSNLQGYSVYRSQSAGGPFLRISGDQPVTATTFTDPDPGAGAYTYTVRAIKLEQSGSGTYFNPSQGIFYGPNGNGGGSGPVAISVPAVPVGPTGLVASAGTLGQISLSWSDAAGGQSGFHIQRQGGADPSFQTVGTVSSNVTAFSDTGLAAGTLYVYRVSAFNAIGDSAYSNQASATTAAEPSVPASAQFVASDSSSQGTWSGTYGQDGFNIIGSSSSYPAYAFVTPSGSSTWTWNSSTSDPRALQQWLSTSRIAAAWNASSSFTIDLDLRDGQPHRVALYCLDWDSSGRSQTIEVIDASSGAVLSVQSLSSFSGGTYLVWNLAGHVAFKLTASAGPNAVVSGLFFDAPAGGPATVAMPAISPDGGTFSQPVSVTLGSATSGASIRYTLDGSDPSLNSAAYMGPLAIAGSATVKAKAFASGMTASATATARFSSTALLSGGAQASFVRTDAATQGNWKGVYGNDGFNVIADNSGPPQYPAYAQVTPAGQTQYLWSDSTTDPRALQKASAPDRVAGCWFQNPGFNIDLSFTDGLTHRLALYCVDWDQTGRAQTVSIADADTGVILDSQTLTGFSAGQYLVWDLKGHVSVGLAKLAGNNAVVMGLFFGPAAAQLSTPRAPSLSVAAPADPGSLVFHISGQPGSPLLVQASADLANWTTVDQVTLTAATLDWVDLNSAQFSNRFYRVIPAAASVAPQIRRAVPGP